MASLRRIRFVDRLHRTLIDHHFRIMGRKKFYDSIEAMQLGLRHLQHKAVP